MHGNDINGLRTQLYDLSSKLNEEELRKTHAFIFEEYATQFCKNGSQCNIHQIEENILDTVGQLMLMNGCVNCVTSITHSLS